MSSIKSEPLCNVDDLKKELWEIFDKTFSETIIPLRQLYKDRYFDRSEVNVQARKEIIKGFDDKIRKIEKEMAKKLKNDFEKIEDRFNKNNKGKMNLTEINFDGSLKEAATWYKDLLLILPRKETFRKPKLESLYKNHQDLYKKLADKKLVSYIANGKKEITYVSPKYLQYSDIVIPTIDKGERSYEAEVKEISDDFNVFDEIMVDLMFVVFCEKRINILKT